MRLIFHVDVNSAFLSWEAARRVKNGEADLRLIPSAVGGDREKRTGIILAKSIPAKKYGVATGEPIGMALRKCPSLVIVPADFRLYVSCSRAFVAILREYAPVVEKYSIDECFLDMSDTETVYPDPIALAYTIKNRIRDELGFTVNIGIGRSKLAAKTASDFEKPDKVHTLFDEEIEEKLWPLPIGDLFSVGHATAERLERAGIRTVGALAHTDEKTVCSLIGNKFGKLLHGYANGIDPSPVQAVRERAKSYSNSVTVEKDITEKSEAEKVLLALTDSVASRMRADGARASCVSVTIRNTAFDDRSHQQKLADPSDITAELYATACKLFDELWDGRTPLRLVSVALNDVDFDSPEQPTFFPDEKMIRAKKVDRTVDGIRKRFGSDTIVLGTAYQSAPEVGKKHKAQLDDRKSVIVKNKERGG